MQNILENLNLWAKCISKEHNLKIKDPILAKNLENKLMKIFENDDIVINDENVNKAIQDVK